jgi:hypothetical protein
MVLRIRYSIAILGRHVHYISLWLFAHVSMVCPGCMCVATTPRSEPQRLGGRLLVESRSPTSASTSSGSRPSLSRGDFCVCAAKGRRGRGGAGYGALVLRLESRELGCVLGRTRRRLTTVRVD